MDVNEDIGRLVNAWCERRALNQLRIVLQHWPPPNGFTDEWHQILEDLRHVRAMCRDDLQQHGELDAVGGLIGQISSVLNPPPAEQASIESFADQLVGAIFGKRRA